MGDFGRNRRLLALAENGQAPFQPHLARRQKRQRLGIQRVLHRQHPRRQVIRAVIGMNRHPGLCDHRPGVGIRIAPHFYTKPEEIELFFTELKKIRGGAGGGR